MKISHWLYGECEFNVIVKKETSCSKCLHHKICKLDFSNFCVNYIFGTSEFECCQSCLHRFTRYDRNSIPCFRCNNFRKNGKT